MNKPTPVFVVPLWLKGWFFWLCLSLLAFIVVHQISKRATYRQLYIENAMQPLPVQQQEPAIASLELKPELAVVSLAHWRGQWVLLHLWATWCPPCREEMPFLDAFAKQLNGKVQVIASAEDERWEDVNRFFNHQAPSFTVALDKNKRLASALGVSKYPETFLISPQGIVVARFIGARDWHKPESVRYFEEVVAGTRSVRTISD